MIVTTMGVAMIAALPCVLKMHSVCTGCMLINARER